MQFASSLSFGGDSTANFQPIAFTSEQSGSLGVPQFFDVQKQWTVNDFPMNAIPVAGVLEGTASTGTPYKMVVVGDGDFPVNGSQNGQQQSQQPGNINLMVNGIDWLSDDTGLIELRNKGIQFRPLAEMENSRKNFLKYLNFGLPLLLVIVYGVDQVSNESA